MISSAGETGVGDAVTVPGAAGEPATGVSVLVTVGEPATGVSVLVAVGEPATGVSVLVAVGEPATGVSVLVAVGDPTAGTIETLEIAELLLVSVSPGTIRLAGLVYGLAAVAATVPVIVIGGRTVLAATG
ncbi:hypothetical protein KDH_48620 [Dictyobacter sp. S3.2.2.5]|uniref:Uncharacterized protein n=1 Tax=Dictyobacter halimunensis TaxID=3026934 RepID=A0ABQ6FUU6_9CHLR|nr:hypothetical protein KDH_48620 [Dictyobacter sp. S3.2.2.5]